jgi:excisionase family DNA binding protein
MKLTLIAATRPLSELSITVVEAGQVLGLSRDSAYEAVRRGDIESIKIGRKIIRIPTAPLRRKLGMGDRD